MGSYQSCPGHEFTGPECDLNHKGQKQCIHCGNCPTFICESETKNYKKQMTCKHEFTGPNCKYHNIASCVYCEFCPKYTNNTSFSVAQPGPVSYYAGTIIPIPICHVHKMGWDDPIKWPGINYGKTTDNGSYCGSCEGQIIWEANDTGWHPVCEKHKLWYDSIGIPTRKLTDPNTYLKASDIKKAVEQLKSASAKPYTKSISPKIFYNQTDLDILSKEFIKPIAYKWNYGFSTSIKTGNNKETVVDRIRWLLECGQGIIKQVDAGEMPSETVLQAFDKALKELRETGE